MKMKKAFTLMELLIVIALIAIIAAVVIVLFNPLAQIGKGYDAKRKHDLAQLQKVMEDYYNDKGCYPKPADICYDVPPPPTNVCAPGGVGSNKLLESQTCHICGNESNSPPFSPYLSRLPCDPQHKQKLYTYEVPAAPTTPPFACSTSDPNATNPCPQWYRVYSNLSNQSDPSIKDLGCQASGCGSAPNYGFDYGVTSPNQKLNRTPHYFYYTLVKSCDICQGTTFEECEASGAAPANIYSSLQNCCLIRPIPVSCH